MAGCGEATCARLLLGMTVVSCPAPRSVYVYLAAVYTRLVFNAQGKSQQPARGVVCVRFSVSVGCAGSLLLLGWGVDSSSWVGCVFSE